MKAFLAQCRGARIPVKSDLPLCEYSTFRIGGKADFALFPTTVEQFSLQLAMLAQSGLQYKVIGNGSNVLFSDAGYRGVMVFTTEMKQYRFDKDTLYAQSGAGLGRVCTEASRQGFEGFAFGCGIPGTVGGGVYMNAGAYGGQIADVLISSEVYDTLHNRVFTLTAEEHELAYRHSVFAEHPEYIILSSTFALRKGNADEIMQKVREQAASRREKQPLHLPSVGSTFKRPEGYFAGKLIEDAGLKGTRVGGAVVSEKHAGFVVNEGGATAADVLALVEQIKERVHAQFGVQLECEFEYVGE
ncbi:MAG: UDP-N-acetylmuramate dehydrogenase [Clostridia bacterium]|jgi:UDP-N-acetylmuramate dehydrogenase|nr:UDP-N-acetylmuramate dehydrogenase [Clostridia bacterium]